MNDFILGFISGSLQTIIGHPLDTIKVLQQQNINIYKELHITRLYKGVTPPIIGNSVIVSSQFGLNKNIYNYTNNYFYSGFLSGGFSSFIVNPFELYKVRMQNKLKCDKVFIYKGFHSTFMRESLGNSFYFGSYFYLYENNILPPFFAGGFAGWISWFVSYPFDVIKTRIQTDYSKDIYSAFKIGNIWKGFMICSLRSIVVNSFGFSFYQYIKDN